MLEVKINAVPSFVKLAAKSKNNLLIVGDPGIGKSSVILGMQDAETKVTMLTGSSTYEETVNGIPYRDGELQKYTKPEWFADMQAWAKEHPKGMNILFVDEFNTADDQVLKTFLSILTEHKVPTQKDALPENTVIVAAMNPADQNNGAEFIRPLASRFITLRIKAGLKEYRDYVEQEMTEDTSVELSEKPHEIKLEDKRGILNQISELDWGKYEFGQMHEINARSVTKFFDACAWLKNVNKDAGRICQAMLGFNVLWTSAAKEQKERRKAKIEAGTAYMTDEELEKLSIQEIEEYKTRIQSGKSPSIALIQAVSRCVAMIEKKRKNEDNEGEEF